MTNILSERIRGVKLTKGQKKIADYFVRNPERVGMSSSMDLAKLIGVSDVSITRFARAIGYTGFSELKNDIYNNLAMHATGGFNSLSLSERYHINKETMGDIHSSKDYLDVMQYNVEKTFVENNTENFDKAISILVKGEHRYIAGFRGCIGVASQFAWLLRMILPHISLITEEGSGAVGLVQDLDKRDCFFMFSSSRYYKNDLILLEVARKRGAMICVVTDSFISPLSEYADVVLTAETKHMGFFHSMVAVTAILEYLVVRISQLLPENYYKRVEERDQLTEDLRIK